MSFGHAYLLLRLAVVSISGGFDIILSSTGKCTLLYALGCLCRSRNALLINLRTHCAGKDATEDFEEIGHSNSAKEMLTKYVVGKYEVRGPSMWRSYERLCSRRFKSCQQLPWQPACTFRGRAEAHHNV